ncbi:MAG: hypothetical protein H6851_02330 [Geminicoccaceae bacterium]|nr:hypothetical protein [Geminicoccaceae bacterium]
MADDSDDDDDNIRPIRKYRPDKKSLEMARRIAEAQGHAFDREATRELGGKLHDVIYADLVRVLEIDPATLDFRSGVFPEARAFTASSKDGKPAVVLDTVFEFWMFSLAHLVCICTFTVPEAHERRSIVANVERLFELFSYSGRFEDIREHMEPYIEHPEYGTEILKLSNLLTRGMTVFVLCHELAHVQLGHLDTSETTAETELQADAHAVTLFRRVKDYGRSDNKTYIHIDPKMAGAPLILSMIFELYEAWLTSRGVVLGDVSKHPPASQRTAQLQKLMGSELNEIALNITIGATEAIKDIARWLGLPALK